MNRREILKAGVLLTGVVSVGSVIAEKSEGMAEAEKHETNLQTTFGKVTLELLDEKGQVLDKPHEVEFDPTENGFTNSNVIKFGPFQRKCKVISYRARFKNNKYRTGTLGPIKVCKGDTVTIKKGEYRLDLLI